MGKALRNLRSAKAKVLVPEVARRIAVTFGDLLLIVMFLWAIRWVK